MNRKNNNIIYYYTHCVALWVNKIFLLHSFFTYSMRGKVSKVLSAQRVLVSVGVVPECLEVGS